MDSQVLTVEVNPPPVDLGTASTYSVLGSTGVVNTGVTHLSGDLGVGPCPTVTGFGPSEGGTLSGTIHAGDATAATARADLVTALDAASSRAPHTNIVGDLGGRTFHAGVHHITAALALTGSVILDGEGDPDAVFIFQTDAAFNTAAGSHIILANDAQAIQRVLGRHRSGRQQEPHHPWPAPSSRAARSPLVPAPPPRDGPSRSTPSPSPRTC